MRSFMLKKRHLLKGAMPVVLVVLCLLLVPDLVFAQEADDSAFIQFLNVIARFASSIAGVLGQIVVALLDVVTIPLMQYNQFSSSLVVGGGWSIVRDAVNMLFVLVLVVIAFGTIFNSSRFEWEQQVPRLMIFAVLINFSRTIAGLFIDVGNVIMFTFVNAFKDIAGGNFIQLFGLREIVGLSDAAVATTDYLQAADLFGAGILSVLMMLIVAAVVLALTAIMAWRIVMLWILIVIAPLAWFCGAIREFAHGVGSAYAQWWKDFTCYVAIGPILAFFLWLTLSVVGSGNFYQADPGLSTIFADPKIATDTSGILLSIFELPRLTSFILGIAMLFAGGTTGLSRC